MKSQAGYDINFWKNYKRRPVKEIVTGKIYDFGYISQAGYIVIYNVGKRDIDDTFAVTPDSIEPYYENLYVGDPVERVNSDYKFDGTVRAVFTKNSGLTRYVVEDDRGVLFIMNRKNLELRDG